MLLAVLVQCYSDVTLSVPHLFLTIYWLFLCCCFFSMVKMLYWMCKNARVPLNWQQLLHAIKRNFEGFEHVETFKYFEERIRIRDCPEVSEEVSDIILFIYGY